MLFDLAAVNAIDTLAVLREVRFLRVRMRKQLQSAARSGRRRISPVSHRWPRSWGRR
ncbi:MAG: hypothetical protein OXD33_14345 [Rhodobacteraceae bacterium]|nr:hypothetical protein [Paracoccaceae bacterium]